MDDNQETIRFERMIFIVALLLVAAGLVLSVIG
jgi:hypothetical protein